MAKIKVLFSSNRNPLFETFTDYIEKAFKEIRCETIFFENRDFIIPGRIRDRFNFLHKFDIKMLNKRLLDIAKTFKPDLFLEDGGWNILPDTIDALKKMGVKTALWTNDVPFNFGPIIISAPYYDFVFTAGTEAVEILKDYNVKNLRWLPFACDPDFHKPVKVSVEEKEKYGSDICFVGSGTIGIYEKRRDILEKLVDFDLGIWGTGWDNISKESSLNKFVRGFHTKPIEWVKVFSASKIALCIHYHDYSGKIPCYQASPKVFEALACGSFLLVDDQKDILSLFKDGEHLVIYKDVDDLRAKVLYYLNNETERKRIAENRRREVLEKHTYKHRIKSILDTIGLSNTQEVYG